jgi:hypothetical protein
MHLVSKRAARGGCYEPKIGRKPVDSSLTPNRGASLYGYSTKARQIEQNLGVD